VTEAAATIDAADAIQPVGFAIVLNNEWLVERVSANIADYFHAEADALIGVPIAALLGGEAVHALRNQLALLREPDSVARLFACNAKSGCFDLALQSIGPVILIEGQRTHGAEHGDTIATIRSLVGRLERHETLPPLLDDAVRQLRALTGFDRVACYGKDGARCAQSVRGTAWLPERLDGNFNSRVSIVADRRAEPVPLRPSDSGPIARRAMLRAPTPELVQALDEIDAVAGYIMPLSVAGKHWGVILAAHGAPRYPNFERQSATGLFVQMLGLLMGLVESRRA